MKRKLKELPVSNTSTSKDLVRHASGARRASSEIRQQLARIGPGLTQAEHKTLTEAVELLERIANQIRHNSQKKVREEKAYEQRIAAARVAVKATFADVVDPAGVVVLLATTGSMRICRSPQGQYLWWPTPMDRFDVRDIMDRERRECLEHYAYRIAKDTVGDVRAEAAALRTRFDEKRKAVEDSHSAMIGLLVDGVAQFPPQG